MRIIEQIDALGREWDVRSHPFYADWAVGALTPADLTRYAAEYRWGVLAQAALAGVVAGPEHAREEREHVGLWERFAQACGARPGPPGPATADCALAWCAGADRLERLAVLYALESAQPEVARTKLAALVAYYGFERGPTTEYFVVHAARDVAHAAELRAAICREAGPRDGARMVARARAALRGSWLLVDGVAAAA